MSIEWILYPLISIWIKGMFDLGSIRMEYLINFLAIFIPVVVAITVAWWQYTRIKKDNLENTISNAKIYLGSFSTLVELMIKEAKLMNNSVRKYHKKFGQDTLTTAPLKLPHNFYVSQLESIDYTNLISSGNKINKGDVIEKLLSHLYTSCAYIREIERLRNSMFPLFDITKTKFDDITLRLNVFILQNTIPNDVGMIYKNYMSRSINSTNKEKESFNLLNKELIQPLANVCRSNNYIQFASYVSELNATVYQYNLNMKQTINSLLETIIKLHTEIEELERLMSSLKELRETNN